MLDEEHFEAIEESLEQTISELSERLDAERTAPARAGQEVLERDLEVHRLTARLRALRRFGLDLCLGQMVGADAEAPVYVGRLGLTDRDGRQLLVDWRSPAAEPFFAATHANPMGLTSRRRYRWTRGRVTDYWDEVFTADGFTGHAAALDDQSAFIASLGSNRSARMRDVLGHHPGRPGRDHPGLLPRCPRGGRWARHRQDGRRAAPLGLPAVLRPEAGAPAGRACCSSARTSPTSPMSPTCSPAWARRACRPARCVTSCPRALRHRPRPTRRWLRLKSSAAVAQAVDRAVRFYEEPPSEAMTVTTPWDDIRLTPDDWATAFDAADPGTPHNEAREQVWEELLTIIVDQHDEDVPAQLLRRSLQQDRELQDVLNRAWPFIEATDLVGDLWSVPAYLRLCAPWLGPDEVKALQRNDTRAWTVSDLPFLDAARQRLGDPEASRRRRRHEAAVAAEREQMAQVVEHLIETDDSEMKVMSMLKGQDLKDRWVDEDALQDNDPDLLAGPFAHIVVDEAQELTDAEWQMLLARCPSRSFTDRGRPRAGTARVHRVVAGAARAGRASTGAAWPRSASTTGPPRR